MQKFLTISFPGVAKNEFSFPFYNVNIFQKMYCITVGSNDTI